MTPDYANLARRAKQSPTQLGVFGYHFALVTLDELRIYMSATKETNPLIAIDSFRAEMEKL
jgi:hypothetical protein